MGVEDKDLVRAGDAHAEGLEGLPGSPHHGYDRRGQGGFVDANGDGVRANGRSSTGAGHAVCAPDPHAVDDERASSPGIPSLGIAAGSPAERPSGCCGRPGGSAIEGPRRVMPRA